MLASPGDGIRSRVESTTTDPMLEAGDISSIKRDRDVDQSL